MSDSSTPPSVSDAVYEQLRNAITEARSKGDNKTVVALCKKMGLTFMEAGDAPQALTEFNEAIKLVSKDEDKESFAQLLGLRGLALKSIGNYSLAMQAFRKSNALAREIKHPALSCDSLIYLAMLQSEMGKIEDAISVLNDSLALAVEFKDKVRRMRIYGLLGDNFTKHINPAKAIEFFQMAELTAQDLGNRAAECSFITKMGNVFLLEGKTENAIEKYERAFKFASALEDRNAEINILGGLFRAHALAGELNLAQVYGEQAINLASQINHFEAEIANIQAMVVFLIEQEQVDKVFPLLERGMQIVHEQTNLGWQMEILNLQGQAYSLQEKYNEAIKSWNAALTLASNLQDEPFMALMFGRMAVVLAETDDIERSVYCAENAVQLAQKLEDAKLAAEQQILLAFNFNDLKQREKAIGFCQAAIKSYEIVGDRMMIANAQALLNDLNS